MPFFSVVFKITIGLVPTPLFLKTVKTYDSSFEAREGQNVKGYLALFDNDFCAA